MADEAFQRQQELKEEALALQASRAEEQIKRQQLAEEKWAAEQIEKKGPGPSGANLSTPTPSPTIQNTFQSC